MLDTKLTLYHVYEAKINSVLKMLGIVNFAIVKLNMIRNEFVKSKLELAGRKLQVMECGRKVLSIQCRKKIFFSSFGNFQTWVT